MNGRPSSYRSTSTRTRRRAHPALRLAVASALLAAAALMSMPAAAPALASTVGAKSFAARASSRASAKPTYDTLDAAQPTGVLVEKQTSATPFRLRLTALNAVGAEVWSLSGDDVWALPGKLPAALTVAFDGDNSNSPRAGVLEARTRSGAVRFRWRFGASFVRPLCDTPGRLVWATTSAAGVTRLYVRQRSGTHILVLPFREPASVSEPGVNFAVASANGGRVLVGIPAPRSTGVDCRVFWLRVDRSGQAHIVAADWTDWVYAAMSSDGSMAYVADAYGGSDLWLPFGSFSGQSVPDGVWCDIGPGRLLVMQYSETVTPGSSIAESTPLILDWTLATLFTRTWTRQGFDPAQESPAVWFWPDPSFRYMVGTDTSASHVLTAVDIDDGRTVELPGTYYAGRPLADGRIVALTTNGKVKVLANPFAGP